MSFYRTYRLQVIDEIDNVRVRTHLMTLVGTDTSKLPHAYILTGPKGSGKTTTARVIAKIFNCIKPTKNGPCGACDQCMAVSSGRAMDVIEIDAASNRGIDDIRTLRDGIHLSPGSSRFKVYIIDEVHMLTTEAFNALLKTLEEPPSHAIFILATTDVGKVPATIISRCTHIHFSRASDEELLHALTRVVTREKLDIEQKALEQIARVADGSFRDAVKMLEQVSLRLTKASPRITEAMVRDTLVLTSDQERVSFIETILKGDKQSAMKTIRGLVADGRDTKQFLTAVLSILEEELVAGTLKEPCHDWDRDEIGRMIRQFTQAYTMMRVSPIAELPFELATIEYCDQKRTTSEKTTELDTKKRLGDVPVSATDPTNGLLTLEKLESHWIDVIESLKPYNHSIAGVFRSTKPKKVDNGVVTIEAFYKFHQERLSQKPVRDMLSTVLKKLFGVTVKVEIVLGKK